MCDFHVLWLPSQMTGSGVSQIHNLHQLHTLNIGSTDVTSASIHALSVFCGTLTDLDMHDTRNANDECISLLSVLTNLTRLNINGLQDITDEGGMRVESYQDRDLSCGSIHSDCTIRIKFF